MALTREAPITATPTSVESRLVPWVATSGEAAALAAGSQLLCNKPWGQTFSLQKGTCPKTYYSFLLPPIAPGSPLLAFSLPKNI